MRTVTGYSKTLSTMMWFMALLLVVLTAGCDRDHGGAGTTDSGGPPTVTSVIPVDISTGVCINKNITATFSKAMLASTITASGTFTVKETIPGSAVTGTVTYDAVTRIATFTTATLTPGTNYTATITTAATDTAGTALAANKVWSFTAGASICAPSVNMGLAAPFGISATAGLTVPGGVSTVNGDVLLLAPSPTCGGIAAPNDGIVVNCPPFVPIINGLTYSPNYDPAGTLATIAVDLNAAFLSLCAPGVPSASCSLGGGTTLAAPTTLGDLTGTLLVGKSLFYPGVYHSGTSILVTNDLTLDAQGDSNATFVFQSDSTVGTAAGAASPGVHTRILLINGAKASNVWWVAASSATINTFSEFQGNIIAAVTITLNQGADSCGRMMAGAWIGGGGAITLDRAVVSVPGNVNAPADCL